MRYLQIFLTISLIHFLLPLQGQVHIERQVVAATGNVSTAGNVSISATAGEAAPTYLISGTLTLSQGFQQADLGAVGIEEPESWAVDYKIYPNPTPDELHVRFETDKVSTLYVKITDLQGRFLPDMNREVNGLGVLETRFSLNALPSAIYLVTILDKNGQLLATHKVRKQ